MDPAFQPSLPLRTFKRTEHNVSSVPCVRPVFRVSHQTRCSRILRASVGDEIEQALIANFHDVGDVSRVVDSFRSVRLGRSLENNAGTPRHQRAHSYVPGLSAEPWHDASKFAWATALEGHSAEIAMELRQVGAHPDLAARGTNVWSPPVVEAALAYGPDWRTLVLQDREWDKANTVLFPKTTAALRASGVPSVEAFFARQCPSSGIALHTDDCNFVLTAHLALDVPHNAAWIQVAGERRYWQNGRMLVFDTSFYHRTQNESIDHDRTVLLIRFWHPELTPVERDALEFLFRAIEQPDSVTEILRSREDKLQQQREVTRVRDSSLQETGNTSRRARRHKLDGNLGPNLKETRKNGKGFAT